jgi:hypothetical protein
VRFQRRSAGILFYAFFFVNTQMVVGIFSNNWCLHRSFLMVALDLGIYNIVIYFIKMDANKSK